MISKFVTSFLSCIILIFCTSCGQTYELLSIEVSPAKPNIVGMGSFQQLQVMAKYSNTKADDVTSQATYKVDPPTGAPNAPASALSVSASGRVQIVEAVCTWTSILNGTTKTYVGTPYVMTASFKNVQSVAFINASSGAGCDAPAAGESNPVIYNLSEQSGNN